MARLVFVLGLGTAVACGTPPTPDGGERGDPRRRFSYPGSGRFLLDVKSGFDRPTRNEVLTLRRATVEAHRDLRIFPPEYDPLAPPRDRIWGSIASEVGWVPGVAYYVANPYAAVVATRAGRATPLAWRCGGGELRWEDGRLTELAHAAAAWCWLEEVFANPDLPGQVRLVTVNAEDAGFPFAHVDLERSANVRRTGPAGGIVHAVHRQRCLFHRGRRGLNNISPADPLGRVTLERDDRDTTIVVKLWRDEPPGPRAPADLEYVVRVDVQASREPVSGPRATP